MGSVTKKIRGTREWAVANIDCCTGCSHDCLYCYARYDAVEKRGLVSDSEWQTCQVNEVELLKEQPLYPGQVMFPTTHDIFPENLDSCITVINRLLKAGNQVLVVSKPHLECVERLCKELAAYKEKILFRFTLTARNNDILKFWEPGAPSYEERRTSLCLAFENGFQTSVSVEPMLDTDDVAAMVRDLLPCVSHSIWLGKMNKIGKRVRLKNEEIAREVRRIEENQTDKRILEIYNELRNEPLVRWKESIKEVVGLELPQEPGLDR